MATIYKRTKSPYWWLKKYDAHTKTVIRQSTGYRIDSPIETRKAKVLASEATTLELRGPAADGDDAWAKWVPMYLEDRYSASPKTKMRYDSIWKSLRDFLIHHKIRAPKNLTRAHCLGYTTWRKAHFVMFTKPVQHNTMVLEVKTLAMLIKEAIRRGFVQSNVATELGVKRKPGKQKPELTEEMIKMVEAHIETQKEPIKTFLSRSWLISKYQGARLSETHVNPLEDVLIFVQDGVKRGRIVFNAKGGKEHVAPLHPKLIPFFEDLIAKGVNETFEKPANPSRVWFDFLRRTKIKKAFPKLCHHCWRVTTASKLGRSQVKESTAMQYVGHSSTTVHRGYQRFQIDSDLDGVFSVLS